MCQRFIVRAAPPAPSCQHVSLPKAAHLQVGLGGGIVVAPVHLIIPAGGKVSRHGRLPPTSQQQAADCQCGFHLYITSGMLFGRGCLAYLRLAPVTDWWAKAMCCATCSRSSSDDSGTSARKRRATLTSASSGHAWNLPAPGSGSIKSDWHTARRCCIAEGLWATAVPAPAGSPIKYGAVDQRRELASSDAELVAHGAEAQHHVQVLAHLQAHMRSE